MQVGVMKVMETARDTNLTIKFSEIEMKGIFIIVKLAH